MSTGFYTYGISMGPSAPAQYDARVDDLFYSLFNSFLSAGWGAGGYDPFFKLSMISDMSAYSGLASLSFWVMQPRAGYTGKPILVVDDIDESTLPANTYDVVKTFTTDRNVVFNVIVQQYIKMGADKGGLEPIGTDLSDPNPNVYLAVREPVGYVYQGTQVAIPQSPVAWHISQGAGPYGGGYKFLSAVNGTDTDNTISVTLVRLFEPDGNNNPGNPAVYFPFFTAPEPELFNLRAHLERTNTVSIDLTNSNYEIAFTEHSVILFDTTLNKIHIEAAACDPIPGKTTVCCFGLASGESNSTKFRSHMNVSGEIAIQVNGRQLLAIETTGLHTPRILCDSTPISTGTLWENGLGNITEPWIAFYPVVDHPAPIVGKWPGGIVIHKSIDPTLINPVFTWDNKAYHIITKNVGVSGDTNFGTLAVLTDELPPANECTLSD